MNQHASPVQATGEYDYLVLGNSLMNLIEAMYWAKQGASVAVIDKSALLGGAWQLVNCCGANNIEVGCHILASLGNEQDDEKVYHFLRSFFKVDMQEMLPRPINILNYNLSEEQLKTVRHYYPAGGVPELFKGMQQQPEWQQLRFITGYDIQSLAVDDQQITVTSKDGQTLIGGACIFPSYFGLGQIRVNDALQDTPFEYRDCAHLVLRVQSQTGVDDYFSYAQHVSDETYFDRVSNVSKFSYCEGLEAEESMLCVRVSREMKAQYQQDPEYVEKAFAMLKQLALIPDDTQLVSSDFVTYETAYRDEEAIAKLKANQHPRLHFNDTGNLMDAVFNQYQRWGTMIAQ